MAKQTQTGKSFEYACLKSIYESLKDVQPIMIEESAATKTALKFYRKLDENIRGSMDLAAKAATRILFRLEPKLQHPDNDIPLYLSIQEDAKGQTGDVRDVLCIRKKGDWEIGLSCKHNHTAVKHPRLSNTNNFGTKWFLHSCSQKYFDTISPIFEELFLLKAKNAFWRDLNDKEERFYKPLLNAFVEELNWLNATYPNEIPSALITYLLGRNDFYKVMANNKEQTTHLQVFNLFGTLNQSAKKVKAEVNVPKIVLPTRIFDISYKLNSNNTVIVTCDNGWSVSMRIHSAKSKVEPSLKFDVKLEGIPATLYTAIEPW